MRPEQPQPLTREEHREMGLELKQARVRMRELATVVEEVYGQQSQAAYAFQRVLEAMETLSQEMQAQAAEDLRGQRVDGLYT